MSPFIEILMQPNVLLSRFLNSFEIIETVPRCYNPFLFINYRANTLQKSVSSILYEIQIRDLITHSIGSPNIMGKQNSEINKSPTYDSSIIKQSTDPPNADKQTCLVTKDKLHIIFRTSIESQ